MSSIFTDHENKINVVIHQNRFSDSENSYYGRITRNTVTLEQLIKGILDDNQNTSTGLNAYMLNFAMDRMKSRILAELKAGNAVSLLGLGTLYPTIKGSFTMDADNADVSAIKGKGLTVGFTPSDDTLTVISKLRIGSVSHTLRAPAVNTVVNLATKETGYALSAGKGAELVGSRLKITGEGGGVYFIPVSEAGEMEGDEGAWVHVPEEDILKNYPKSLIFQVPDSLETGKRYVVAVRTLYCGGNTELKTPVTGYSPVVEIA